jgi:hypothetical protein
MIGLVRAVRRFVSARPVVAGPVHSSWPLVWAPPLSRGLAARR